MHLQQEEMFWIFEFYKIQPMINFRTLEVTITEDNISVPTSDYPRPFSGPLLDLCKPSSEVTGFKHIQRQRRYTLQDDPILALFLLLQVLILILDRRVAVAMVRVAALSHQAVGALSLIFHRHDCTRKNYICFTFKTVKRHCITASLGTW